MRVGWLRLLLEIAFILGVAAITWAARLSIATTVVVVLLAWLLTAVVERRASQHGAPAGGAVAAPPYEEPEPPRAAEPEPEPEPVPEPEREPEPVEAPARRPGLLGRISPRPDGERRRPAPEAPAAPTVRRIVPEPEARDCVTCGNPIPPERLLAVPDATQCLDCKRAGPAAPAAQEPVREVAPPPAPEPVVEPAPVAEPEPESAPVTVAVAEPVPAADALAPLAASSWNVWELERRARARAGLDVARDEEWSFLLVYLREFADADGNLPADFDGLVRESFAELIAARGA